jgi:hypothetical protein
MPVDFQRGQRTLFSSGLTVCDWLDGLERGIFFIQVFMEIICHARKKLEILVAQAARAHLFNNQVHFFFRVFKVERRRTDFCGFYSSYLKHFASLDSLHQIHLSTKCLTLSQQNK